ncbi:MAG: serine/threonine protein kinase, partial [Gemmatimonadota bacterium]|nr:serine/threonine protein kinase [Gemmatimonadota bacterium]
MIKTGAGMGHTECRHRIVPEHTPGHVSDSYRSDITRTAAPALAGIPLAATVTDPRISVLAALADRYEIAGEIGRGGMATVYRAHDKRHGSDVAIKLLRPELVVALGGERFTREIRVTAALQHPNILPLLDSGEMDGLPYYVMPFVSGASLEHRLLQDGPLPIGEAIQYVAEIADGLAYAHSRGFVHRDIKPANILLSQGHALLADFGIARVLDAGVDTLTESGLAIGTAAYMSPEQAAGERVDARADIYALGCVLYELLTGTAPFTGASQRAIMARHAVDPVPSARTVRREVPAALESVVERALAKMPADRFADASAFRNALLSSASGSGSYNVSASTAFRSKRWALGAVLVAAVMVVWVAVARTGSSGALDSHRVMVFPLVVAQGWTGAQSAGEDASAMIGSMMDGVGSLRWVDGWQQLTRPQRDNMRSLVNADYEELARKNHARFFVTGRMSTMRDSASVLLQLHDLEMKSDPVQLSKFAPVNQWWRAASSGVAELLPKIIPGGSSSLQKDWTDRNPQAIALFLAGEAAFRHLQRDSALTLFKQAVSADSTFGFAALRGAQA